MILALVIVPKFLIALFKGVPVLAKLSGGLTAASKGAGVFAKVAAGVIKVLTPIVEGVKWVGWWIGKFLPHQIALAAKALAPFIGWILLFVATLYGVWANRKLLIGFWEDFVTQVKEAFADIGVSLKAFKTSGTLVATVLREIWSGITFWFRLVFTVVKGVLVGIFTAVKTILPNIAKMFAGVFSIIYGIVKAVFLPIFNLIAAAIHALAGDNEKAMERLQAAWENLVAGIQLIAAGAVQAIWQALVGIGKLFGSFAATLVEHIGQFIINTLEQWGVLDSETAKKWRDIFTNVWETVSTTLEQIGVIIQHYGGKISKWFNKIGIKITLWWFKTWGPNGTVITALTTAWNTIVQWFKDLYDKLIGRSLFTDLVDGIAQLWTDTWEGLATTVEGIKDTLLGAIQVVIDAVYEKIELFLDIGNKIVENIVAGIKEKWDWAVDATGGALKKIKDFMPFSEPKDRSSPLYGLSKSGEAFWENWLAGAERVDVAGALEAKMADFSARVAGMDNSRTYNNNYAFGAGAMTFPNVTRASDATGFMDTLNERVGVSRAKSYIGAR
jgi:hypothetical protein